MHGTRPGPWLRFLRSRRGTRQQSRLSGNCLCLVAASRKVAVTKIDHEALTGRFGTRTRNLGRDVIICVAPWRHGLGPSVLSALPEFYRMYLSLAVRPEPRSNPVDPRETQKGLKWVHDIGCVRIRGRAGQRRVQDGRLQSEIRTKIESLKTSLEGEITGRVQQASFPLFIKCMGASSHLWGGGLLARRYL